MTPGPPASGPATTPRTSSGTSNAPPGKNATKPPAEEHASTKSWKPQPTATPPTAPRTYSPWPSKPSTCSTGKTSKP
nr:MAG TPA: hypothetical protein [Caudoviricetes sp.]